MGQFNRKKPFSGKQKKLQLKLQKQRRANAAESYEDDDIYTAAAAKVEVLATPDQYGIINSDKVVAINKQPEQRGGAHANRFNLQFCKAKLDAEFEKSKIEISEDIEIADPSALEYSSEDFFPDGLTYPERPPGYQSMTKDKLEMLENRSVQSFSQDMEQQFGNVDINLFEHNVETWKQLWRVMDKSDVLLYIVDIRFAVCQFPPYLYKRLMQQRCGVVLVLNKVDLVPASLVVAWRDYFKQLCPGIEVVPYCSHETIRDKRRQLRLAVHSSRALIAGVEKVAPKGVDLTLWKRNVESKAILQEAPTAYSSGSRRYSDDDDSDSDEAPEECEDEEDEEDEEETVVADSRSGSRTFTIGTIGYPNVGKSSLINAIMGRHMVGVSRTPGFTKHFQTHYITSNKDVMLCDCPGLVFPAICPYKLQVLSGSFPVSQVRSPMAVVGFLAAHINVPRALGLKYPNDLKDPLDPKAAMKWSPFLIAEGWATKRHYNVKGRGGRVDTSRAANELLRLSLMAKQNLVLSLKPRGYAQHKGELERCDAISEVKLIQGVHATTAEVQDKVLSFDHIPRGYKAGAAAAAAAAAEGSKRVQQIEQQAVSDEQNEVIYALNRKNSKQSARPKVANKFSALLNLESDDDDNDDDDDSDSDDSDC